MQSDPMNVLGWEAANPRGAIFPLASGNFLDVPAFQANAHEALGVVMKIS